MWRVCGYPGIDATLARMERQLQRFDARGDHRGAFLRVYAHMTRRVRKRFAGQFFVDPAWVERVAVRFADYYFNALTAYDGGRPAPPAWQLAFDQAVAKRCFLLQDICLGVNAHINNDLPQVLAELLETEGDWGDPSAMQRRRFDHDQINRILREIVPAVEGEVARHYGRLVAPLGRLLGSLDESLTAFGLKQFRDNTWREACFLVGAAPDQRGIVKHWIETDAAELGGLIARYGARPWMRPFAGALRRLRLF